jgi:CMP-N-acetylneuraminic acid synthetase
LIQVLGVIPARGGSKGIPRKNLTLLGGRPLIAYACDAARGSRTLTRVLVNTDDAEIARAAEGLGVDVPFLRPPELAGDDTPMIDVLVDLLSTLDQREAYRPDVVVLLQPTSPFRRAEHVDAAVRLLQDSGADSVVSVVAVPHQFTPASLMRVEGGRLLPADGTIGPMRRQDKATLFARNGPAVVAVRTPVLREQRVLYGADTRPLVMTRADSIDIDDAFDLQVAELLLMSRSAGRTLA